MGKSMVRHFMQDGHTVYVYNRTKSKTDSLVQDGANWCDTPKELVKQVDVVMTMVGYPHDVEEVYFGIDGILENANEGRLQLISRHLHQHWQNVLMKPVKVRMYIR